MAERTLPKQDATTDWHPKASATETQSKRTRQKNFQEKCHKEILTNYSGGLGQQKLLIGKTLLSNTTYKIWPVPAKSRMGETIGDCITYTTTSDAIMLKEAGELQSLLGNNLYDYTSLTLAGAYKWRRPELPQKDDGKKFRRERYSWQINLLRYDRCKDCSWRQAIRGKQICPRPRHRTRTFCQLRLSHKCYPTYRCHNHRKGCLYELQVTRQDRDTCFGKQSAAIQRLYGAERHRSIRKPNSNYSSDNGVLLNAQQTNILWFPMGKQGEYSLPNTITSIGNYAFKECSIETFILPDNMKEIGQGAFMDSKVKEVKLPANLKRIPTSTFQGCKQLKVVRIGSKTEAISDYAFDLCPLTDIYVEAKLPPVCSPHAFTTRGTSFLNTCIVHVPTGKAAFYKGDVIWKQFKEHQK